MMTDHRSVLRRADADLDSPVALAADDPAPEPLCPHQRLLPHPHQPVPGRDRGSASTSSTGSSATRSRSPTKRIWSRSGISCCVVFVPLATISILAWHGRVLRLLEFRPAMAALDDGVLHLPLAPALDALPARASEAAKPTTPTSASRRTSAASSAARAAAASTRATWASTITPSRRSPRRPISVAFSIILWGLSGAMDAPIFGVEIPGFLFWVAVLYACFATGMIQLIGRRCRGSISASRRSRRISVSTSRASASTASRSRC